MERLSESERREFVGSVGGWRVSAVYSESVGSGIGNGQDTVVVLWVEAPGAAF
jgi:hypothetical protein